MGGGKQILTKSESEREREAENPLEQTDKSVKISPRSEDDTSGRSGNHSEDSLRTSKRPRQFLEGFRGKKKKKKFHDEELLLGGAIYHEHKFWNRFGSAAFRGTSTMPMSGGTRMLRARRKDCNVKPNRRLDRKSSRGMLFENEELRMRTITINAEVEQGQHALKKLRRENEQLRREMWCLRDEYDKMEKLLKKREEGEESDQENSDSDENCTRTDESDEDNRAPRQHPPQGPNPDFETSQNLHKLSHFGNEANVRAFDGLSVIDEQTEETQTTESAAGYGTLSRGNSANRTFNHSTPLGDEPCITPELPPYGYGLHPHLDNPHPNRKRGLCLYENSPDWPPGPCDTYDVRPSSPYPYNGSFRPSYQKRFQLLQELPLVPQTPPSAIGENGWLFPDPSKLQQVPNYNLYVDDPIAFLSEKPPDADAGFGLKGVQDRGGPDVFVTGGYSRVDNRIVEEVQADVEGEQQSLIANVEAEMDKIEIGDKCRMDPKIREKSGVSRDASERPPVPAAPQETLAPGKLTMDAAADQNDNSIPSPVQQLVACQNSNGQHVRETIQTAQEAASDAPPPDDMPLTEKPSSSKYQTKLLVTLKSPGPRADGRAPKRAPAPLALRTRPDPVGLGERFQTLPSLGFQAKGRVAEECPGSPYVGPRGGLFGSLPRLTTFAPKSEMGATASNIPDESDKDLDVLPDEESPPLPSTHSLVKPVKIPPVPPPRTSSCPKPIIPPPPPLALTATQQRSFRKGKPLQDQHSLEQPLETAVYNPLLMSQPIATSSPTISLKGTGHPLDVFGRYRKPSYTEDSSLEDFSRHKVKSKEDVPKLNKSLSSPSFGSFRTPRRKQSEGLATSVENILSQKIPEAMRLSEKAEKKVVKRVSSQNNASVSSSSGLDSPTKSESRKRRVSIQLKKKQSQGEEGGRESGESRRESTVTGVVLGRGRGKGKGEETDATTSERERTNSVSSRTSSVMGGSSRRKYSISSNRTYLNEEKIPWCGCWGNGCV